MSAYHLAFKIQRLTLRLNRVEQAVRRAEKRAMHRPLGFIRTTARRSLRVSQRTRSTAGNPPKVRRSGSALRRIFYQWDSHRRRGLVGPVKVSRRSLTDDPKTAPHSLEKGAVVRIRNRRRTKSRSVVQTKRPFMISALMVAVRQQKIPNAWQGKVTA